MRFLPLLSSDTDPSPWNSFPAVELAWGSDLHPGWVRSCIPVHALHLPLRPWGEGLVLAALGALRSGLQPDFLVIPAETPKDRRDISSFLGGLEALLEALSGRGIKIALRSAPGSVPGLVALLKEMRCDAVGYCWDDSIGADLEAIADRLFCAVGSANADYPALQRLGYRWNVAIATQDPVHAVSLFAHLQEAHPMIYFPQVTP